MTGWDLGELARATEGTITGKGLPVHAEAVGTDTRSLPPASIFVALRGDRFDGHAFVDAAIDAGALAVVIDTKAQRATTTVPFLVVEDTLRALGDMAAFARRQQGLPVIAVTGSNGKTTTKELCAAACASKGAVHKTAGNFNNLIGLPLTLLAWPENTWAGVVEMGMNAPGEITRLTEIAQPDVGIITNVAAAHLEGLGTLQDVARAKGELFAGLPDHATAIVNSDDALVEQVAGTHLHCERVLRFGTAPSCDVRIVSHQPCIKGTAVTLDFKGAGFNFVGTVELPLPGGHNASNAAAAAAAAIALGLAPEPILQGLANVSVPGGRMRVLRDVDHEIAGTKASVHVIDDSYNANPHSMTAAIAAQQELAAGARRIAVLGDMFELGSTARDLHRGVGRAATEAGVDEVLALGELATAIAEGSAAAGGRSEAFTDIGALLHALDGTLRNGDWVLVKGSRGMRMERIVAHLLGEGVVLSQTKAAS